MRFIDEEDNIRYFQRLNHSNVIYSKKSIKFPLSNSFQLHINLQQYPRKRFNNLHKNIVFMIYIIFNKDKLSLFIFNNEDFSITQEHQKHSNLNINAWEPKKITTNQGAQHIDICMSVYEQPTYLNKIYLKITFLTLQTRNFIREKLHNFEYEQTHNQTESFYYEYYTDKIEMNEIFEEISVTITLKTIKCKVLNRASYKSKNPK